MSDIADQMDHEAMMLMDAMDTPALAADARAVLAVDAMDDLKKEVMGFFKNRIAAISRAEHIKDLVFQQLENEIPGGELNFEQKMTVLARLARDNNDSADSIISMFRPSGNGQGSLLTEIVRPEADKTDLAHAFENYTPEELRKIDQVAKVIRDIVETGARVEVNTSGIASPGMTPVAEV
jgi:hypothetical protein